MSVGCSLAAVSRPTALDWGACRTALLPVCPALVARVQLPEGLLGRPPLKATSTHPAAGPVDRD